jgi:hypothetical protein
MRTPLFFVAQAGFAAVTFIYYGLALKELARALSVSGFSSVRKTRIFRRAWISLLVWIIIISTLSLNGFFSDFSTFPPRMAIVFVVPMITILIVTFSKTLGELLPLIPAENIIRLQSFRVLVEVLLWLLFIQNLLPVQMTFEGRNWDILAGVTGPIVAYFYARKIWPKTAAVIWNVAGLVLLLNIMGTAVLSMPTPFRLFMNEPSSAIVAQFPFVWLPALLVPLAYGLHFFSLRQLSK